VIKYSDLYFLLEDFRFNISGGFLPLLLVEEFSSFVDLGTYTNELPPDLILD